jgi:hypothetical protein
MLTLAQFAVLCNSFVGRQSRSASEGRADSSQAVWLIHATRGVAFIPATANLMGQENSLQK